MAKAALDLKGARKEITKLRSDLKSLIDACENTIAGFEVVMKGPSTPERGKSIARLLNYLELHKDIAKRFGLGIIPKDGK